MSLGAYELKHECASISTLITSTRKSTDILFCDEHGYQCFILILRRQDWLCLYNASFFRKLILTGFCLVTQTVKVISMDLEHRPIY